MIEVAVEGVRRLRETLETLPGKLRGRLVEDLTGYIWRRAVEFAPTRTGFLRENIAAHVNPDRGEGEVVSQAPYSAYVEYGTRPHPIFPRRAQALRFEVGGRTIFSAYVKHPGAKPQPFIRRAAGEAIKRIREIIRGIHI